MVKSKYTFGGMPLSDAKHWDDETKKELGSIVYKITSGKSKLRLEGHNEYYEFKRFFTREEWDEYVDALERYRESLGHRRVGDIVREIGKQLVKDKVLETTPEPPISTIPQTWKKKTEESEIKWSEKEGEQLAFF